LVIKLNITDEWLSMVAYSNSGSGNTRQCYEKGLKMFCHFIGETPEQIVKEYEESKLDKFFRRKYTTMIRKFIAFTSENYAKGSVQTFVSAVKSFFKYIDLPLGFIPITKNLVTYHNRDIKKSEIREVLTQCNPRDKAFFCVIAQSGLRPFTLCQLKLKHVEELYKNNIPCLVRVPKHLSKGKYKLYITFIAEESINYLKTYLKKRKDRINQESFLFTQHGKEEAVTPANMSQLFMLRLKETTIKYTKSEGIGKPSQLTLYSLRKWFRNRANIGADSTFVKSWMGHTLGTDEHYFSIEDVERHRKEYAKTMPYLQIETSEKQIEQSEKIQELKTKIIAQDERIEQLQKDVGRFKHFWQIAMSMGEYEKWQLKSEIYRQDMILGDIAENEEHNRILEEMEKDEEAKKRIEDTIERLRKKWANEK